MKALILKLLIAVGNTITRAGAMIGIVGAILAISCIQELDRHDRQQRR